MPVQRWHLVPILLVSAGVLAVWIVAAVNWRALGWWQVLLEVGGLVALAAVFWFRRELGRTEIELEALRKRLADDEFRLNNERAQVEELRRAVEQELSQQASRLGKREQALADRLVAYHEWTEFPQPVDLASPRTAIGPSPGEPDDEELADLARKDRQLNDLLKAETKLLYEKILANEYAIEGQVQPMIIRDDIFALVHKVVLVYRPDVERPLLEASTARILRGTSRACLQLLVVLDELPLNVKDASLNTLYGYVRNAVKAWQMYKSSEPYWPYVNAAWYLGRFALGANPLALGTWWFVGSLSQRGATAVATHLVNRQALALLSSLVRVIGYEVAGVYGGNFRHRDANWIYAAELSELLSLFPLSRDSLSHALREIGVLELRSEYDRIFLYRSLASHKSARPQQYRAAQFLTMDERHAVAQRLEKFLEAFVHGKTTDRVQKWKQEAEDRLGIKMTVALGPTNVSVRQQIDDALRSLASFLIATKQLEPSDLRQHLTGARLLAELSDGDREQVLAALVENPPFFFEHPDLDPESDLVSVYLEDLAALHARTTPRDAQTEETLSDVAIYLRRDRKLMQSLLEKQYSSLLAQRFAPEAPVRKFAPPIARAALDLLEPGEQARFLYGGISLDWPEGVKPELPAGGLWLLGVGQRLILFSAGEQPQVVWRGDATARAEQARNLLATSCRVTGGEWLASRPAPLALRVPTSLMSTYNAYFRPLAAMLDGAFLGRSTRAETAIE
ncbi:MAG: hypothetical protein WD872_09930 [Pirellulaceae bacterium]